MQEVCRLENGKRVDHWSNDPLTYIWIDPEGKRHLRRPPISWAVTLWEGWTQSHRGLIRKLKGMAVTWWLPVGGPSTVGKPAAPRYLRDWLSWLRSAPRRPHQARDLFGAAGGKKEWIILSDIFIHHKMMYWPRKIPGRQKTPGVMGMASGDGFERGFGPGTAVNVTRESIDGKRTSEILDLGPGLGHVNGGKVPADWDDELTARCAAHWRAAGVGVAFTPHGPGIAHWRWGDGDEWQLLATDQRVDKGEMKQMRERLEKLKRMFIRAAHTPRQEVIIRLTLQGKNQVQIADELKLDKSVISKEMKRMSEDLKEEVAGPLEAERDRLNGELAAVNAKLTQARAAMQFLKVLDDPAAAAQITGPILSHAEGPVTDADHAALLAEIKRQLFGIAG